MQHHDAVNTQSITKYLWCINPFVVTLSSLQCLTNSTQNDVLNHHYFRILKIDEKL